MDLNFVIIQLVISTFILICLIFLIILHTTKTTRGATSNSDDLVLKIRDEIRFSLQPMTEIPLGVEEITELAVEIWKIEQRIIKANQSLSDANRKGLENSLLRIKKYLQKFDVEVQDYTGQKYNEGLNFDVLSREQDSSLEYPIIKETIEPTVICRGRIVKRAKVILASNQT